MTTLQARVPEELAEAARERAGDQGISLSRYLITLIEQDVARAAEEKFWQAFTDFYADPAQVTAAQAEAESFAGSLADGLGSQRDSGR